MLAQKALTIRPDAHLRQQWFGASVMRHPAKQSLAQLIHLLERFAVPGDVLLDPFGGSGSSMVACAPSYGGMYVVTVELAAHFLPLQDQAWQHFQCAMEMQDVWDTPPGDYLSLQGDSRDLAHVLQGAGMVDLIITSPSYGGSEAVDQRKTQNTTIAAHGGGNVSKAGYQQIDRMADNGLHARHGGGPHSQISAKQFGYVDTIITSPPYQDALHHDQVGAAIKRIRAERGNRGNGNVSTPQAYDVDLVITSPPYQDSLNPEHAARGRTWAEGELPPVMKVMDKKAQSRAQAVCGYGTDGENIGNLKGKKYLDSMRAVWRSCAEVLKPGGILCCITRDCVKDGKRVPVGEQNRALLLEAGLEFLECETWAVPNMSFWRILQQRKNPDAPLINTEQVYIFRKPLEAQP